MRSPLVLLLVLVLDGGSLFSAEPDFPLTEDSKPHAEVPKGELLKGQYTAREGSVFPGTERDYTIYLPPGSGDTPIPADNRDKSVPAPFMVFQDGVIYQAPTVFDNLIARKEIPPLIGIFIKPGVVPAANDNSLPRYNRSYEYDSVSDTYARFLIDEFLPAIEAKYGLKLSTDPNDAAISGNSSGGICAFIAAWHRPDRFRRVFTGVGTYVGIRGADQLPVLVRKMEPKPLRVFLQSGTGDNNLYCGDWWMANQTMERALTWAGYDVNHAWGEGGHNQKHASQIFPEVLRWLWRDYATAKEIKANPRGESKWRGYEVVGDGTWGECCKTTGNSTYIASNTAGEVYASVQDGLSGPGIMKVNPPTDKLLAYSADWAPYGLAFSTSGDLIVCDGQAIRSISQSGESKKILDFTKGPGAVAVAFTRNGHILTSSGGECKLSWSTLTPMARIIGSLDVTNVDSADQSLPTYIALSPDQTLLYVSDGYRRNVACWHVHADGSLSAGQAFFRLDWPENTSPYREFVGGLCVDTTGWLYVATALGIQVCDQAGRVNFIIPTPQQPHDICFGGKDLSSLFIACGDKIYQRQTKARGIVSGQQPPIKPAPPKL